MSTLLSLTLILPFASATFLGLLYLFTPLRSERFYALLGIGVPLVQSVAALSMLYFLIGHPDVSSLHVSLFEWLRLGEFHIDMALRVDHLGAVMISFITFVGTLIHIYAAGYMRGDAGYGKFFAFFHLFMAAMTLLVLADNPIIMFIGWELVGLASYLLIGFWHHDLQNVTAANKAFIVNRVGDFGFIIGLSLLFIALEGSGFDFASIKAHLGSVDAALLAPIGLLLFVGAMGKSAQLPLYVWLPDAMAGPTPVSALIHAATMVTAGVYMVARFDFLYVQIPDVGLFIATIGILSALFAALVATQQRDIKKILAYSTMSQLGYMFVAVGLGAYGAGIFHVFTHAFFKALLFMGAGAVIIALHHEQDIFKMGGLKKSLPLVFATMLIATLAISGIPPFAGFFSKDAILVHAFAQGHTLIWALGLITAMLTAYYMFRLLVIVFIAPAKKAHKPLHVTPLMSVPLVILAIGSTLAGFLGLGEAYGGSDLFGTFLQRLDTPIHASHATEYTLSLLSTLAGLAGAAFAYRRFAKKSSAVEPGGWQKLLFERFYIDTLYDMLFVRTLRQLSLWSERVIDGVLIDGAIGLVLRGYRNTAEAFGSLQNGRVRLYALYILAGISLLSLSLLRMIGTL